MAEHSTPKVFCVCEKTNSTVAPSFENLTSGRSSRIVLYAPESLSMFSPEKMKVNRSAALGTENPSPGPDKPRTFLLTSHFQLGVKESVEQEKSVASTAV